MNNVNIESDSASLVSQEKQRLKYVNQTVWFIMFNGELWYSEKAKSMWTKLGHAKSALNNRIKNFLHYRRLTLKDSSKIREHLERTGIVKYHEITLKDYT